MATYSYDPAKCQDGGMDQMRFELGDTLTDMDGMTSPLCDEEYKAILSKHGKNWKKAKFLCLDAICKKLAYEVNMSVDGLSYSFEQRYNRFQKMRDDAKKELAAIAGAPVPGHPGSISPNGGTPYFYNDLHANPRKF